MTRSEPTDLWITARVLTDDQCLLPFSQPLTYLRYRFHGGPTLGGHWRKTPRLQAVSEPISYIAREIKSFIGSVDRGVDYPSSLASFRFAC